jgi:hypothetical protein
MKTFEVEITGTTGLLQNKMPDDLELTEKRGEGKDSAEKAEGKLYKVGNKIVQPALTLENAMLKAAVGIKQRGMGKKTYKDLFKGSVFVKPEYIPHLIQTWEVHKTFCVIPSTRGKITRYRPLLPNWRLSFKVEVLDDRLPSDVLKLALDEAGRTVGIGDWRPRFGRFVVSRFKEA